MPLYFDTSAFGPLFLPDVHSSTVEIFLRARVDRFVVSDLTMLELVSIASRSVRARRTTINDGRDALARANQWVSQKCDRAEIVSADYTLGEEYVRRFDLGLRAPDALHVAICRRLGLTLLTCDIGQASAAREFRVDTIELSGAKSS